MFKIPVDKVDAFKQGYICGSWRRGALPEIIAQEQGVDVELVNEIIVDFIQQVIESPK